LALVILESGPSLSVLLAAVTGKFKKQSHEDCRFQTSLFQQGHLRPKRAKKKSSINDNKIHADYFLCYTKDYHLHFLSERAGLNSQDY